MTSSGHSLEKAVGQMPGWSWVQAVAVSRSVQEDPPERSACYVVFPLVQAPVVPAVPAAAPVDPTPAPPSITPHRRLSRSEVELALLLPFLSEAERPRFLIGLAQAAWRSFPWPEAPLAKEPRAQLVVWAPIVPADCTGLGEPDLSAWLKKEVLDGLRSVQTPLALLSRPVRMYWLLRQGQRAGQVYAALERLLGDREQALDCVWRVVAGL